jgi:hypothetical protein
VEGTDDWQLQLAIALSMAQPGSAQQLPGTSAAAPSDAPGAPAAAAAAAAAAVAADDDDQLCVMLEGGPGMAAGGATPGAHPLQGAPGSSGSKPPLAKRRGSGGTPEGGTRGRGRGRRGGRGRGSAGAGGAGAAPGSEDVFALFAVFGGGDEGAVRRRHLRQQLESLDQVADEGTLDMMMAYAAAVGRQARDGGEAGGRLAEGAGAGVRSLTFEEFSAVAARLLRVRVEA